MIIDRQYPEALQYQPDKRTLDESVQKAKLALLNDIKRSVYIYRVDCGGCNGCEIEIFSTITPVFDAERFGIKNTPSPRHADILVYTGAMTRAMRMPALRAYDGAPFSRCHVFRKAAVDGNARAAMETYGVRATGTLGAHAPVRMLSGGNQQKIILAREIVASSRLIVASQPTRGLDVSASAFVRKKLLEQKRQGKGVLLISAELEEILALSDRVAVLYNGKIAGVLPRAEVTVEKLGRLMSGLSLENEEGAEA